MRNVIKKIEHVPTFIVGIKEGEKSGYVINFLCKLFH